MFPVLKGSNMTGEFTYYALFLMLSVTTGIIFQFYLGQIRKMKEDITKMNASIVKLHQELRSQGSEVAQIKSKSTSNVIPFRRPSTGQRLLKGNLELEYQGSKANTRAIFHVDDEI